jgi:diguanylate cyclase (GGDEF)-like protein
MAHYDGLTNLANRFLFNETLAGALLRRRSHDHGVAVLYLDLDRFKAINDTLGHPVGDKLLCEIARRIRSCVRKDDLVARLGGDEFAVLMHGRHVERIAEKAAQRIIRSVRQPCLIDDGQVLTSTSIGIAISTAEETDAATLMKQADLALYVAKGRGRGVFSHFEPGMDEAATLRRELEMDLRTALTEGQFELHYQPLSMSARVRPWPMRHWCDGITRRAAWSCPTCSFRLPKRRVLSSRWAIGSSVVRVSRWRIGPIICGSRSTCRPPNCAARA